MKHEHDKTFESVAKLGLDIAVAVKKETIDDVLKLIDDERSKMEIADVGFYRIDKIIELIKEMKGE